VSDIPDAQHFAVMYREGDFEAEVPRESVRLAARTTPACKSKDRGEAKMPKAQARARLWEASNAGCLMDVIAALREGAGAEDADAHGYTALHWAAGPEEYMPGDTIERRACIALLTRLGAIDRKDSTNLAMAGLHHSIALNLVGCAKTFLHLGADSGGAAHWAASCKSHAALRELLRLGVEGDAVRGEWDGSSPLMLAAAHGDSYGLAIILEHATTKGDNCVRHLLSQTTANKAQATVLHIAADAASELCVELLLELRADPFAINAREETPLQIAKKRRHAFEKAPDASRDGAARCCELLEVAQKREYAEVDAAEAVQYALTPC